MSDGQIDEGQLQQAKQNLAEVLNRMLADADDVTIEIKPENIFIGKSEKGKIAILYPLEADNPLTSEVYDIMYSLSRRVPDPRSEEGGTLKSVYQVNTVLCSASVAEEYLPAGSMEGKQAVGIESGRKITNHEDLIEGMANLNVDMVVEAMQRAGKKNTLKLG